MSSAEEKVSIIIPAYQAEKYLEKCLESVRLQSYPNIEVIVIDDGSTDASAEICDKIAEGDKRFMVVHQKNQGVSVARNCGLDLCTGKYIMFIDADDWIEPDCCGRMMRRMNQRNYDIGFFEMIIEKEKAEETIALETFLDGVSQDDIKQRLLKATIPFHNGDSEMNMVLYGPYCKVFERGVIANLHFKNGLKYGEDAIFNLQAILNANSFCFENNALYHYRKNNISVTSSFKTDRIEQSILRLRYTNTIIADNGLYYLSTAFDEMFVNMCFWIIDNLFSGRKQPIHSSWLMFRKMTDNQDMRSLWKQVREEREPIRILDAMFSGNLMTVLLAFLRLRYSQ